MLPFGGLYRRHYLPITVHVHGVPSCVGVVSFSVFWALAYGNGNWPDTRIINHQAAALFVSSFSVMSGIVLFTPLGSPPTKSVRSRRSYARRLSRPGVSEPVG
ncbi:uncharacterized protein B0T23DRAFT_381896 [Neurospora hispaniola]|uniref:Uncharacterized protein n=1 Tax=Neurospora hispaniola TaxID=588809 RepID=A0AAJ0I587_9PEZI|nr:hypothetical protein B0T23DRAFT_381896 [Neurospora hispaniola]